MLVAQYFNTFIIISFAGWIYECLYCTICEKHWENRGFLFGPVCPIYGSGFVLVMLFFGYMPFLKQGYNSPPWLVFLICAVMSAIIEYFTSLLLEKVFHAVWWDYNNMPLNLHGRISLPTTCAFGLTGIFVVRFFMPFLASLELIRFAEFNELLALIFMLLLGIDISLTVASLTNMMERMAGIQKAFDKRMQAGYELAASAPATVVNAAKNSAIVAKNELAANVSEYIRHLPFPDKHHLMNIKAFRTTRDRVAAENIVASFKARFLKERKNSDEDTVNKDNTGRENV